MGFDRSGGFKVGDEIEVSCDDEGFHGAWYEATVARRFNGNRRLSIVYASLLSDTDTSQPLQESVDLSHVRPRPPRSRKRAFELFQLVEGYHRDGWWPGVVAGVRGKQCLVIFPSTKEELEFPASKVRPRLHWLKGQWIAAGEEGGLEEKFSVGAQVEVTRDKEIYGAAWFPGRVVRVICDTYFLVEYENQRPNDITCTKGSGELLREIVDAQYMRPSPPDTAYVKDFCIQDEVEVLVYGRWLAGVISKIILFGSKYVVKLKYRESEEEFDLSEVRLHYDWANGQWICASMHNRGKSVLAGKTMSIDGRRKSGVEGSSPQVQINGTIANESSEQLSHNMILRCKGRQTSRQKQVSKSRSRKRTAKEPQLDIVMPKRKKSDGSDNEDQCRDPQPQKNKEETTLMESMEEQCHSESYLQGKSTISTQTASESPPDPNSDDLLYEQFKRNLYEVTGTPDLSAADMGNHENSNGANRTTTKRIKKIAVRNSSRLRKSLDLDVRGEPTEDERIERTGKSIKNFAILENVSVACEQEHIKKSAEVAVETENARREVELPSPNPSGYLNNEKESVMRNEFATPIGDIIGDLSETYVSTERINRRLKILDTWTLPRKDDYATPRANYSIRSEPRESMGGVPLCTLNETVIEVPLDEDSSNIHQEPITNWLTLKRTAVDKVGVSRKLLANNSTGKEHVLPFEKNSAMWKPFESLEIFHMMPQQPHFRALEQYCEEFREGMAIGFMVTFANLINDVSKLRISDSTEVFLAKLKALLPLEANGFDVQCLRSRIEKLVKLKCELNQHETKRASLEELISERNNKNAQYDAMIAGLDKNIMEVEKTLAHLQEKRSSTIMLKKTNDSDVVNMQMDLQATEEAFISAGNGFHAALIAPWW